MDSDSGVGAVLSLLSPKDGRIQPCVFLSKKLLPAEKNCDIGNRELLAVKVALEEWYNCLEGADHKNFPYLLRASQKAFSLGEGDGVPSAMAMVRRYRRMCNKPIDTAPRARHIRWDSGSGFPQKTHR